LALDNLSEERVSSPPFSISETTTYLATFEEDLAAYKAAGVDGIGIWELKLPNAKTPAALRRLARRAFSRRFVSGCPLHLA
jgi:sugar phosphate isomerase/epimerase